MLVSTGASEEFIALLSRGYVDALLQLVSSKIFCYF